MLQQHGPHKRDFELEVGCAAGPLEEGGDVSGGVGEVGYLDEEAVGGGAGEGGREVGLGLEDDLEGGGG